MMGLDSKRSPRAWTARSAVYTIINETVRRLNSRQGRRMALMLAGAEPESELFKAFSNRVILNGRTRRTKSAELLQGGKYADDGGRNLPAIRAKPDLLVYVILFCTRL